MIVINSLNGNVINLPESAVWALYTDYRECEGKTVCAVKVSFPVGDDMIVAQWDAATEETGRIQAINVKAFIANTFSTCAEMCVLDLVGLIAPFDAEQGEISCAF